MSACRLVLVGLVKGAFKLDGSVRIHLLNPESQVIVQGVKLFLLKTKEPVGAIELPEPPLAPMRVELVKPVPRGVAVKLTGVESREQAERLAGRAVYVERQALPELEPDEYYLSDLIGMSVVDGSGKELGKIVAIETNNAQDLLVIEHNGLRYLLPNIPEFVHNIDIKNRVVEVDPPPGFFEDETIAERVRK